MAAFFWGLVVFLPVGMGYLAFFLLAICLLAQDGRADRLRRVRRHPTFWPMLAYLSWTVAVWALQPVYFAQTPSNLWHGLRIVLTLGLALALTRDELVWAVRGCVLATAASVALVALDLAVGLPTWSLWHNLLHYSGNKSISNALLLAVAAGSALVVALARTGSARRRALGVACTLACVLVWVLPSRTALLLLLAALPLAALHQWRGQWRRAGAVTAAVVVAAAVLAAVVPAVQARIGQGLTEAAQAVDGEVTRSSWNLRIQMLRHTTAMVAERPWLGWGIGAWNTQWQARAPALVADLNMPHNDLLWMGAQAGIPGALAWLAIWIAACRAAWRRTDLTGRTAFVAALALLFSALVNSATRDAAIGLSLIWFVAVYLRLADEAGYEISIFAQTMPA